MRSSIAETRGEHAMASLWQKGAGIWCVAYRENGKQHVRSLRTRSKRAGQPRHVLWHGYTGIRALPECVEQFPLVVEANSTGVRVPSRTGLSPVVSMRTATRFPGAVIPKAMTLAFPLAARAVPMQARKSRTKT